MLAALTAHPDLGCTGGPYELWTIWGVADDVLCAGNEKVYTQRSAMVGAGFPRLQRIPASPRPPGKPLHTQRLQLLPPARITPAASASLMPGGKLARLLSKLLLETTGEI